MLFRSSELRAQDSKIKEVNERVVAAIKDFDRQISEHSAETARAAGAIESKAVNTFVRKTVAESTSRAAETASRRATFLGLGITPPSAASKIAAAEVRRFGKETPLRSMIARNDNMQTPQPKSYGN